MGKIIKQIIRSIIGFFNRIVVKEAERVFEFNSQVLSANPIKEVED